MFVELFELGDGRDELGRLAGKGELIDARDRPERVVQHLHRQLQPGHLLFCDCGVRVRVRVLVVPLRDWQKSGGGIGRVRWPTLSESPFHS